MKNLMKFSSAVVLIAVILFTHSCDQPSPEVADIAVIKNTIKSVSLFEDSVGIDPIKLYSEVEVINKAIDSIGYPNAGYKIWEVITDDTLEFRFMVEGYWPDKEIYDKIHDHELYKEASSNVGTAIRSLNSTWYYRFQRIQD